MVFADLDSSEKDAFFALLDEYFASRPDVFGALAGEDVASSSQAQPPPVNPLHNAAGRAAASAIHNAFTAHSKPSPEPTFTEPSWRRTSNTSSPEVSSATVSNAAGRVAAAAAMFGSPASPAAPPRPPPRRVSSSASPPEQYETPPARPPPVAPRPPASAASLVQQKKFGDVDLTSGKNMYLSIRHGTANKTATPPPVAAPVPAALPHIKNSFAPPPRRVPSAVSSPKSESKASPPPPPPPPRPQPEPEGEWAEAMYEYTSDDPGDLPLEEGQRVLIIERTSDDWWTGEYEGRRGLVPASYVKVL
ncbi:SH3 domain-containing protein [Phanerochaete sordida]|uniref:SH3 domain-containing protein n=1 Tax=Phanerochaete sordida TaxID=48140 RepID=A0A9P3FX91_9APHY|nr:SH3 domain-containing protein [Phanerochaete sordida]